ncbi:MAG: hypothetical protein RLZZ618_2237 [Pseudomonadota bacterium]|jgi:hypothetical protein
MKRHLSSLMIAVLAALSAVSARGEPTGASYAGEQQRAIKSLSDSEVAGLLAGRGAGFAKAAELNGYPGPAHVLELATQLHLSDAQTSATRELMDQHLSEAMRLGAALLDAERHLDSLFAQRMATPGSVDQAAARVGALHAQLRAEHLKTHLAQTALLNAHQIERYASLRGYGVAAEAPRHSTHAH